jgi:hypothetical protein
MRADKGAREYLQAFYAKKNGILTDAIQTKQQNHGARLFRSWA